MRHVTQSGVSVYVCMHSGLPDVVGCAVFSYECRGSANTAHSLVSVCWRSGCALPPLGQVNHELDGSQSGYRFRG